MNVGDSMRCNKCDMNVELKWNYCPYCENKINSINQLELDTTKKDQVDDHCEKCGLLLEKHWKVCPKCGDKNSFFFKEAYENNSEVKKNEERKIKERKRSNSKLWVLLDIFCLTFAFPLNLIYYFFILKGFGTTLIDENASCHLALGAGFPECIKGGLDLSDDELLKAGVNVSKNHVDFMIGTPDLTITGTTKDGKKVPIFVNGNYTEELLSKCLSD